MLGQSGGRGLTLSALVAHHGIFLFMTSNNLFSNHSSIPQPYPPIFPNLTSLAPQSAATGPVSILSPRPEPSFLLFNCQLSDK